MEHSTVFCSWKLWIGILKDNGTSSEVLTAVLWESRARKLCTCQSGRMFSSCYHNKCLCLASEKFVLASKSNLSLATGLASWKVSLEPWVKVCICWLSKLWLHEIQYLDSGSKMKLNTGCKSVTLVKSELQSSWNFTRKLRLGLL